MKKVLIIGFTWPEPSTTAAGKRMLQLIKIFKKNKFSITFASTASKTAYSYDLNSLDIATFTITLNDPSFDDFIVDLNPNIVLFDRFLTEEQFGWRVTKYCPNAIKILDTEDLHFLRSARSKAYNQKVTTINSFLYDTTTYREIASIYRCDLSLIISKYEYKLLTSTFKIDKKLLLYIPFLIAPLSENSFTNYPDFYGRSNFISIGNFKHEPNKNAALVLKTKIWPLIKKELPKARLNIYGAYVGSSIKQLHNEKNGFIINGWASNLEEVFVNSRVCLAPIQFGAGLKGKLIDAMQYGTPNVTTSVGAEGMQHKLAWSGFIEDDIQLFSERAIKLYKEEKLWIEAQQQGIAIINKNFSDKKFEKKLIIKIEELNLNLKQYRNQNFIGRMLEHHTLNSSKYLAKWIELKNSIKN